MKSKLVLFLLLFVTIFLVMFIVQKLNFGHFVERTASLTCSCPKQVCPQAVCQQQVHTTPVSYFQQKKEISKKLADIYQELTTYASHKKPASPKLLLQLKGIIGELDPAHKLSQDKEPTEPQNVNTSILLDVCPEKYMGELTDYPFYHKGWQIQNCVNIKPLNQVISIVLNTMEYPEPMEKQVDTVLQGINRTYPQLKVFLAAKTTQIEESAKKYPNIKTIPVTNGSTPGKVWNQLINDVATPYTLVARDVVHFTWVARIERQIRMISTTEHVGIAGGSFRNLTGHWRVGCRQTKLFNYVLQYEEGYHYSRHSCMFCDDLEGPFVAKTDLLKGLKFSEKYSKEIVFEEFFLRVSRAGNLILNCPDAMYFTTDYSTETKQSYKSIWRPLATDMKLVRVVLVDYGVRHKFSCSEISYKCSTGATRHVALPMCCLEQFGNSMKFLQDMSVEKNISFELDSGSNLACLKFYNYSPFDLDGDIMVYAHNMSTLHNNEGYVREHGFSLTDYKPATFDGKGNLKDFGYFHYNSPDIYTEVWGYPYLSADKYSPPELNKKSMFTKCRINNRWINSVHFPGMYARNRYGPDVLKHSQSWLQVGNMKTSFSRYKPGSFLTCNNPTFHACLDSFPADGNIAFKVL